MHSLVLNHIIILFPFWKKTKRPTKSVSFCFSPCRSAGRMPRNPGYAEKLVTAWLTKKAGAKRLSLHFEHFFFIFLLLYFFCFYSFSSLLCCGGQLEVEILKMAGVRLSSLTTGSWGPRMEWVPWGSCLTPLLFFPLPAFSSEPWRCNHETSVAFLNVFKETGQQMISLIALVQKNI